MSDMVTWEYLMIDSRHYKHDDLQPLLNNLGAEPAAYLKEVQAQ